MIDACANAAQFAALHQKKTNLSHDNFGLRLTGSRSTCSPAPGRTSLERFAAPNRRVRRLAWDAIRRGGADLAVSAVLNAEARGRRPSRYGQSGRRPDHRLLRSPDPGHAPTSAPAHHRRPGLSCGRAQILADPCGAGACCSHIRRRDRTGGREPQTSSGYREELAQVVVTEGKVVSALGLEPRTYRLKVRCSTN